MKIRTIHTGLATATELILRLAGPQHQALSPKDEIADPKD
jgi:hypothetical protein